MLDRALGWMGPVDRPRERAHWLGLVLLGHAACESAVTFVKTNRGGSWLDGLAAATLAVAFIMVWRRRAVGWAAFSGWGLVSVQCVIRWPHTANHAYLVWIGLCLLCVLTPWRGPEEEDDEPAPSFVRSVRWLLVIVLFWTGLQKVLAGQYFAGQMLSLSMVSLPRFEILQALVPAEEVMRLRSAVTSPPGGAPFVSRSALLLVVSNGVWIGELGAAVGLTWRRLRSPAVISTIVMMFAIQVVARELLFGLLVVGLVMSFAPRVWLRPAGVFLIAAYLFNLAAAWVWPGAELG